MGWGGGRVRRGEFDSPFISPFSPLLSPLIVPRVIPARSPANHSPKGTKSLCDSGIFLAQQTSQGGVGVHRKRETGPPLAGLLVSGDSRAERTAPHPGRRSARRGTCARRPGVLRMAS